MTTKMSSCSIICSFYPVVCKKCGISINSGDMVYQILESDNGYKTNYTYCLRCKGKMDEKKYFG